LWGVGRTGKMLHQRHGVENRSKGVRPDENEILEGVVGKEKKQGVKTCRDYSTRRPKKDPSKNVRYKQP